MHRLHRSSLYNRERYQHHVAEHEKERRNSLATTGEVKVAHEQGAGGSAPIQERARTRFVGGSHGARYRQSIQHGKGRITRFRRQDSRARSGPPASSSACNAEARLAASCASSAARIASSFRRSRRRLLR